MAIAIRSEKLKGKTANGFGKIGVLMGGASTEREISLKSGKTVFEVLQNLKVEAVAVDIKTENKEEVSNLIKSHNLDCAFLALHGRFGEDGQIQELLDNLKIPYTGSGVLASRLAMDKVASRRIFEKHGINVPRYKVLDKSSYKQDDKFYLDLTLPWVVKPSTHGSSIGLSIVDRTENLRKAIDLAFSFDEKIIIEEYISGREMTVGILDDKALPVIEIIPKKRFFDYEAKYQAGMTDYVVPAQLHKVTAQKLQSAALLAHKLLGCFGCCRVDMILNQEQIPYILELNSIPGLTRMSLLPKAAGVVGIDFGQLCITLIRLAHEKAKNPFTQPIQTGVGFSD